MAQQLEPEKVDLQDIPEWIRQSHGLICRRWGIFAALTLLYVVISAATQRMGYLTLPLGYIITLCFLSTIVFTAKAADDSLSLSFMAIVDLLQKIVVRLLLLGLLISVITLAALVLGSWLVPILPETVNEAANSSGIPTAAWLASLTQWVLPAVMRFFVVYLSIVISGMWFLLPLLVFHSLSLIETALLSKKAERINISVLLAIAYGPLFGIIVLLLLHDISYVITALLIPYFGAIQYVSYRHVFTHKKKNSPARALSSAFQSLTA